MEYVVGLAVVIALCLCLGVGIETIILCVMAALVLLLGFIVVFFIYCLTELVGAKKENAVYSRIDKNPKHRFDTAFYSIDGVEYPNALPCEIIFRKRFYQIDKTVSVMLTRKNYVYDRNALFTVAVGIVAGGISAVACALYLLEIISL